MNADGIAAEVVFPNTVPPFYPRSIINAGAPSNAEEYRLRWAGVKAHNRWLADFCAQAPGRRAGMAQVFLYDVEDAAAEVRAARDSGLMGVLIPADHSQKLENLYERRLDPFWAACTDVGLPVSRHAVFVGPPETEDTGPATDAVGTYEITGFFRRGLAHLVLGGVFERFPDLKFLFTETNTSWVLEELQMLEIYCAMGRQSGTPLYAMMHRAVDDLSLTPREYYERNVWVGASISARSDIANRHELGVDRVLWGSDYPHHEGSFPHTRVAMRWLFEGVPEPEVRAMTSLNAAKVYGFDLDCLQGLADEIGPTPEEIAAPLSAAEVPDTSMCTAVVEAIYGLAGAGAAGA
jgi:predicted TIM-barrel fold metal-dependent hydrolase